MKQLDTILNEAEDGPLMRLWREDILIPYLQRKLTNTSDNLVALSAVTSRFQSTYKDTYLAGLWKEDLIRELLRCPARGNRPVSYYSWSWASADGRIVPPPENLDSAFSHDLVKIIDASVTLATSNRFGPVSHGSITLRALMIPATLCLHDDPLSPLGPITSKWGNEYRCSADLGFNGHQAKSVALDMKIVPYTSMLACKGMNTEAIYATRISTGDQGKGHLQESRQLQVWILPLRLRVDHMTMPLLILGPSTTPICFKGLGMCVFSFPAYSEFATVIEKYRDEEIVLV